MSIRAVQRVLFSLAAVGLLGLGGVFLVAFATPERPYTMSRVSFGPATAFEAGTVTTFIVEDDRIERVPPDTVVGITPGEGLWGCPRMVKVVVHLVRLGDGTFAELSARSPHLGEMVPWMPEFSFEGMTGWFREPCHGDTYALDGTRVFGPAPRGLDSYPVEVDEDGHVVIDLGERIEGRRSGMPQMHGTPAPAATTP